MQEKGPEGKPSVQFTEYPIEVNSFLLGDKDEDLYLPEEAAEFAELVAEGLEVPNLREPLKALGERAATVPDLYAVGIGFLGYNASSPSSLHMDVLFFAKTSKVMLEAIKEIEKPLHDAEWNHQGRGIKGNNGIVVTTGTSFSNVTAETLDETIERFKSGRMTEIIPMHLNPLEGVVVLRVGQKPNPAPSS